MTKPLRPISVERHKPTCAALWGHDCRCDPAREVVEYERVCAVCAGRLGDKRRTYCSRDCKTTARVRRRWKAPP